MVVVYLIVGLVGLIDPVVRLVNPFVNPIAHLAHLVDLDLRLVDLQLIDPLEVTHLPHHFPLHLLLLHHYNMCINLFLAEFEQDLLLNKPKIRLTKILLDFNQEPMKPFVLSILTRPQ